MSLALRLFDTSDPWFSAPLFRTSSAFFDDENDLSFLDNFVNTPTHRESEGQHGLQHDEGRLHEGGHREQRQQESLPRTDRRHKHGKKDQHDQQMQDQPMPDQQQQQQPQQQQPQQQQPQQQQQQQQMHPQQRQWSKPMVISASSFYATHTDENGHTRKYYGDTVKHGDARESRQTFEDTATGRRGDALERFVGEKGYRDAWLRAGKESDIRRRVHYRGGLEEGNVDEFESQWERDAKKHVEGARRWITPTTHWPIGDYKEERQRILDHDAREHGMIRDRC